MRILYFDCFNGASGDMILGALLDAGLPLDRLRAALGSLGLEEIDLHADRVLRAGVSATKFRVAERQRGGGQAHPPAHEHGHPHAHEHGHPHAHHPGHPHDAARVSEPPHDHGHSLQHAHATAEGHAHTHGHAHAHAHRGLPEILSLVDRAALSASAKVRARALFQRLAEAEAAIHQMPVARVHLHEVGALDSIVDIVGAVFAFEWFAADAVVVSPLNLGGGMVRSAHGVFPVPAPATVRLLGDAPVYSRGPQAELLTPTGALLLSEYASRFGPVPAMRIERVGYGAGDRDFADTPNVLRVLVGEAAEASAGETIVVLACEIDDMNPQIFGVLMEQLYAAGALEVFYQPVQMKKNRPGTLVTVLAAPDRREALLAIVFRETTTIGVRYHEVQRERLEREIVTVETSLGPVRIKVSRRQGAIVNASPEFDDCARLAAERGVAVKDVQAAATRAWTGEHGRPYQE
jgi:pyridinium-3,5-bisthiocarboxylic acid mononucleotide nickel chelatase